MIDGFVVHQWSHTYQSKEDFSKIWLSVSHDTPKCSFIGCKGKKTCEKAFLKNSHFQYKKLPGE